MKIEEYKPTRIMKPEGLRIWFENVRQVLETAYLSSDEPWRQSGMSGPEDRWIALRKPVADCIDKSGSFLEFLLANHLKQDGKLLIANYTEDHPNPEEGILPGCHPTKKILERLAELGYNTVQYRDGYDTVKNRKTRIAVLTADLKFAHQKA